MGFSAGTGSSFTKIGHHAASYSLYNGKYTETGQVWNEGRGLFFRTRHESMFVFETSDGTPANLIEIMRLTGNGKFGIGTPYPQRMLHVSDVMRLEPRSTPPGNPAEGDIHMDSTDHRLKVYDEEAWQSCWYKEAWRHGGLLSENYNFDFKMMFHLYLNNFEST